MVQVLEQLLGRLHRLAVHRDGLQGVVEALAGFLQPVLQLDLWRCVVVTRVQLAGVDLDGVLDLLEQVLVVDDVAVVLVLAVEAIGPADGLEQPVVLHGLVQVQDGAARRVEAGEQLVDHDEQLHLGGLFAETALHLIFVGLSLGLARLRLHVLQQLDVGGVDDFLGGVRVGSRVLLGHVASLRIVGGDHCTSVLERGAEEQVVVPARLVDARRHEHRGPALPLQPGPGHVEVPHDVVDDAVHAALGTEHLLHGRPVLAEQGLLVPGQALGLDLKPLVDVVG